VAEGEEANDSPKHLKDDRAMIGWWA